MGNRQNVMGLLVQFLMVMILTNAVKSGLNDKSPSLDFDYEDEDLTESTDKPKGKEQALQDALLKAMSKPEMRQKIGQVIPILRAMSPPQRLTLAALVSSQVLTPSNAPLQSMDQVAGMFGAKENVQNVTENLLLPISFDIAKMFRGLLVEAGRSIRFSEFPTAAPATTEEAKKIVEDIEQISRRMDTEIENFECEHITSDICVEDTNYPESDILRSIRQQLGEKHSFLSEFSDMNQDEPRALPLVNSERRQDQGLGNDLDGNNPGAKGHMCPSSVKYARPKRARTTSGQWKYIVNTGDYTQTLRLEMCMKQGASCSYLNNNYKSTCSQVYNYHRLMTWSAEQGLHMDVFKVPSCCSCHVQGYAAKYPPNDFPFAAERRETTAPYTSNSGVKREIARTPQNYPEQLKQVKQVNELPVHEYPQQSFSQQVDNRLRPPDYPKQEFHPPLVNVKPKPNRIHQNSNSNPNRIKKPVVYLEYSPMNEHLVPPGPPLPLEPERRPRPGYEHRRRPANQTRFGENQNNVFVESSGYLGQKQDYGSTVPKRPPRPIFVTPPTPTTGKDTVETVHVTPKIPSRPIKSDKKKINYNYHPIIDFFTRETPSGLAAPAEHYNTRRSSNEWTPVIKTL